MKYIRISAEEWRRIASQTSFGNGRHITDQTTVSQYGATPYILALLWKLLCPYLTNSEPYHLLWWLFNCKHYPTKELLEKAIGVSAPTSRKAMKPIKEAFLRVRAKVVRKKSQLLVVLHVDNIFLIVLIFVFILL
jgi:hypothetical protein